MKGHRPRLNPETEGGILSPPPRRRLRGENNVLREGKRGETTLKRILRTLIIRGDQVLPSNREVHSGPYLERKSRD